MKTPLPRRIFFWTLFVSYFVTTGIVLFFVFGYRHDFKQQIFVHTGSLTLKTNPKTVSIKLNNKTPKSRLINVINNSYFLTGLRPGQYEISLTANEFKQWTKNINIHSGVSTEFWNILLLRQNYERTKFDIKDIDKFFPAPQENIFATTSQLGKTLIVHVFDTKKDESINSFVFPKTTFTNNSYENIEWSPDGKSLIIPSISNINNSTKKDYTIASVKTNEFQSLSNFVQNKDVHSVRWAPEEKNSVYFLSKNILYVANLDVTKDTTIMTSLMQDVLSYDFADDGLYILDIHGNIVYSADKKEPSNIKILTKFDINSSNDSYRLISYDNHRVVLIDDKNGDFYLYNKGDKNIYTKKLGTNIVGAHFSDDGKKLLFYSPFEIFIYITRDLEAQPIRLEDQMQSIIRYSQSLNNIHFAKDYEHIIYTIGNEIKITELDYRGDRITDTITTLNNLDTTVINKHKNNTLLFLDDTENNKKQLQSIKFPEKETLF